MRRGVPREFLFLWCGKILLDNLWSSLSVRIERVCAKKNSEWECYYCIFKWMLHAITFLASDWTPLVFLFWLSQDVLGVDCHHRNNCSVDYKGNCITILPSHHIFLADDNKFILVLPLSSSFLWSDQEVKFYLPLGCICKKHIHYCWRLLKLERIYRIWL